jgi:acyl-CoA synthetase (AMP-forming)/AMP-acid ligase II
LLTVQQLMYGGGFMATFPFLLMGIPQIVMSKFNAAQVIDVVERFGVTSTFVTSTMLPKLVSVAGQPSNPRRTLRRVIYGGTKLPLTELQAALQMLGPVLVQVYGRLEVGWPITVLDQTDHEAIMRGDVGRAESCGRPVGSPMEFELRPILGAAGESATEVCARSELTIRELTDEDGWCRSGDLAALGPVEIHREFITAAARWIFAAKL